MEKQTIVEKTTKSMGVTLLLTILFGPLGMFYSTITGGAVMLLVNIVVAISTMGFGLLFTWPVCVIWAVMATNNYNKGFGEMKVLTTLSRIFVGFLFII